MELFPHQIEAIKFCLNKEFCLIADEMGLGKTITSLHLTRPNQKTLIVAPKPLLFNWKREILRVYPTSNIQILDAAPLKPYPGFVIVNYEKVSKYYEMLLNFDFDFVILDEAHRLRNLGQTAKSVLSLAITIPKRVALSGTPIINHGGDLFCYFLLNREAHVKQYHNFASRYAHVKNYDINGKTIIRFSGLRNTDELKQKMAKFMIRRKKQDVLSLPPVMQSTVALGQYEEKEILLVYEIQKGLVVRGSKQYFDTIGEIAQARYATSLKKIPLAAEFIAELVEQGQKVIVFVHHKDVAYNLAEKLQNKGHKSLFILGDTSAAEREKAIQLFNERKEHNLIIVSIRAGGVGINLQAASTICFLELDWTYAMMEQAIARAHRIGQKNSLNVYYLVFDGSIDAMIANAIMRKENFLIEVDYV